jgi:ribosome-binding factor A
MPRARTPADATPSHRTQRVAELIRHAAADLLSRGAVSDPVLEGHIVTVPEVRMSPDLRLATLYVMPLGGEDVVPVLAALERHKKFIRGEIARRIALKFAPDIRFRADESFDKGAAIDRLLASPEVTRDLGKDDASPRDGEG